MCVSNYRNIVINTVNVISSISSSSAILQPFVMLVHTLKYDIIKKDLGVKLNTVCLKLFAVQLVSQVGPICLCDLSGKLKHYQGATDPNFIVHVLYIMTCIIDLDLLKMSWEKCVHFTFYLCIYNAGIIFYTGKPG